VRREQPGAGGATPRRGCAQRRQTISPCGADRSLHIVGALNVCRASRVPPCPLAVAISSSFIRRQDLRRRRHPTDAWITAHDRSRGCHHERIVVSLSTPIAKLPLSRDRSATGVVFSSCLRIKDRATSSCPPAPQGYVSGQPGCPAWRVASRGAAAANQRTAISSATAGSLWPVSCAPRPGAVNHVATFRPSSRSVRR